jgi:cytochrome b561
MQIRNSALRYGDVAQALHWVVAALIVVAWVVGTFGDDLPKGAARSAGLFVHVSAGSAILGLVAGRFLWRMGNPPPPHERTPLGAWADHAATLMHYALYALLVAAPVAGIVVQFARGDALPFFGLFEIASPWPADRAFAHSVKEVHEVLANGVVILASMHAAAALVHHWVFRDRTLLRMLPG